MLEDQGLFPDGIGADDVTSLAAIVASSRDAIVGISTDGLIRTWNLGAQMLYGYLPSEIIGRPLLSLIPQDVQEPGVRSETVVPPFETVRLRSDGTRIAVSVRVSPILDKNSRFLGFSEITREVSPAVAHERAMAQLAAIVDSSDDAIIGKSIENGVIESWNGGAERLYGYTAEEVIGRPMSSLLPKALLEEERNILLRVQHGERVEHFDTVRIHKDGRAIQVSLTISPIRNSSGEIIGVSHIARDVSETKRLKDKLQVAQKMEALGRLAGGVAHDFNNLLTVISGYGRLLQVALKDNFEHQDMANEVMAAAAKAAELTHQLLIFSRNQVVHLQPVDLNDLLTRTMAMLRRLIGEDITVETHLAPGLASILADSGQIGQVLMNLAANARDAMPDGGKITIQTESWVISQDEFADQMGFAPGSYVRLLFSDTGCGMDAATRSHVFEPFFTTKEMGKGTGLGMATVYGIVKQCGGQIGVYSELGRGTTFSICFPCTAAKPESGKPCDVAPGRGTETILLVEDEPAIRKLAISVLQANGYKVLQAANSEEALSQVRSFSGAIPLLLTDIIMPGTNGEQLASLAAEQRPDMRVIFMSGYTEHAILERILADPSAAFLQKPFTPDQLLKKIREVLD